MHNQQYFRVNFLNPGQTHRMIFHLIFLPIIKPDSVASKCADFPYFLVRELMVFQSGISVLPPSIVSLKELLPTV